MRLISRCLLTAFVAMKPLAVGGVPVVADGAEWRQLTETVNLTWNQVNLACGSGLCSAGVGPTATLNGWYWADTSRVRQLFDALIQPGVVNFPTVADPYYNVDDPDIEAALTVFESTHLGLDFGRVWGWSRSRFESMGGRPAFVPFLLDRRLPPGGEDVADLTITVPVVLRDPQIGVWLYRPVPDPGLLALFGLGLAGLGVTGRRKAS